MQDLRVLQIKARGCCLQSYGMLSCSTAALKAGTDLAQMQHSQRQVWHRSVHTFFMRVRTADLYCRL